ncbi:MAG: hypothetical protein KF901_13630 [Myxococcales bacterium]|nr:hypothetical protein [Myxococcales bacterium]
MHIEAHADLRDYFHDRLKKALGRLQQSASPATELYLLELLAAGRGQALATPDQPLVDRLRAAVEAEDLRERLRSFRDAGDAALYTCGFFPEHLDRRGMSRDYYHAIGGRAYHAASELDTRHAGTFVELARGFSDFTLVLEEVREETVLRTPQDIVKLYDRWRRTRSPQLAARLHAAGVFPQVPKGEVIH